MVLSWFGDELAKQEIQLNSSATKIWLGFAHTQAVFKSLVIEPLGHYLHDPLILTNSGAQLHTLFIQT